MRGKKAARAAPMLALADFRRCSAARMSGRRASRSDGRPVGTALSRSICWSLGMAPRCGAGHGLRRRLADQQGQCVVRLRALARQGQRGGAGGLHQRFVGAQVQPRRGAHFGALLRELVGARARVVGLLRQRVLLGVGALGVVGLGPPAPPGRSAPPGAPRRWPGRPPARRRSGFSRGRRNPARKRISPGPRRSACRSWSGPSATGRPASWPWSRRRLALRLGRRSADWMSYCARASSMRRAARAQVAVVVQRGGDQLLQARIGEILAPAGVDGVLLAGTGQHGGEAGLGARAGGIGREGVGDRCGGALVGRRHRAGRQQRRRQHGQDGRMDRLVGKLSHRFHGSYRSFHVRPVCAGVRCP